MLAVPVVSGHHHRHNGFHHQPYILRDDSPGIVAFVFTKPGLRTIPSLARRLPRWLSREQDYRYKCLIGQVRCREPRRVRGRRCRV
jgi:hypothetical protein